MSAQRNIWPLVVVLGAVFSLLNLLELFVLDDAGWPEVVGLVIGIALVALGLARTRGWSGVGE